MAFLHNESLYFLTFLRTVSNRRRTCFSILQALAIAIELGDSATEAQACYSLGNTASLLGEHDQGTYVRVYIVIICENDFFKSFATYKSLQIE
uniref:Uncharacterized protein n=1 Tax=Romanomermis culicivorax TaxID=13658 RepID=A0A915IFH3_ROMCU